ncbi:ATP-binding protein [Streptomyces sp. NPDC007369]|uniref:ATP-binding protein n=1 Tax=Streptomyces sp. NPDC007369 TaxID=3154589 RepID=UPI0033CC9BFC
MIGHRLHYHRDLGEASVGRPGSGLDFVRGRLSELADRLGRDVVQNAVLVACELLTNARVHTRGPVGVDLVLDADGGQLTVGVSDPSSLEPFLRPYRPAEPHGHGMHIVDGLATAWGVSRRPGGKTVWATLAVEDPPSAARAARAARPASGGGATRASGGGATRART